MRSIKYHPGGQHMDPELIQATWERQAKYHIPDGDTYPGSMSTDRDSGYPGSTTTTTYRPPTEDSAYFERDMSDSRGKATHLRESAILMILGISRWNINFCDVSIIVLTWINFSWIIWDKLSLFFWMFHWWRMYVWFSTARKLFKNHQFLED